MCPLLHYSGGPVAQLVSGVGGRCPHLGRCQHDSTQTFHLLFFFQVCGEKSRFEKLMEFFCNDDNNIDFMVKQKLLV